MGSHTVLIKYEGDLRELVSKYSPDFRPLKMGNSLSYFLVKGKLNEPERALISLSVLPASSPLRENGFNTRLTVHSLSKEEATSKIEELVDFWGIEAIDPSAHSSESFKNSRSA